VGFRSEIKKLNGENLRFCVYKKVKH